VARANGLAVYTPQAWGINAKRPGFIVDYKFMADIISVDAKNLYLLLEPGVTWEQVLPELASRNVRVALPAAARSPYVLESALEREVVLPAVRFTNKQLSTFHVLLADGREYRSGSDRSTSRWRTGARTGDPTSAACSPALATRSDCRCADISSSIPSPRTARSWCAGWAAEGRLARWRRKCARGEVGTEVIAMSKAKAREVAGDFDELATWSVAFGLEGSPKLVAYQEKRIKELSAELKLKPVAAKAGLSEAMSQALGRPWYAPDLSFGFYNTPSAGWRSLSALTELGLKGIGKPAQDGDTGQARSVGVRLLRRAGRQGRCGRCREEAPAEAVRRGRFLPQPHGIARHTHIQETGGVREDARRAQEDH